MNFHSNPICSVGFTSTTTIRRPQTLCNLKEAEGQANSNCNSTTGKRRIKGAEEWKPEQPYFNTVALDFCFSSQHSQHRTTMIMMIQWNDTTIHLFRKSYLHIIILRQCRDAFDFSRPARGGVGGFIRSSNTVIDELAGAIL